MVQIENVREFQAWGPLDEKGKPVIKKNGQDFLRWRGGINSMGYHDDWRMMNSANYGSYTSRDRLFGIFVKPGLPIIWPEPTHAKEASSDLFSSREKWKSVKDCLDLEDVGNSIIYGKKRSPKTYKRVYEGCVKHLIDQSSDIDFISYYYKNGHSTSLNYPCTTLTTKDRASWVRVKKGIQFINSHYSTLTIPKGNLITGIPFIFNPAWGGHSASIDKPSLTIVARQDKAPLNMVTPKVGNTKIPIYEDDCEYLVKLKLFMAENGFVDICMRCLKVIELLRIQGFPEGYKLAGNQTNQKKFIGNSVVPLIPKLWIRALSAKLKQKSYAVR